MHNWAGTAYGLSALGRDASTGNILDVAPQTTYTERERSKGKVMLSDRLSLASPTSAVDSSREASTENKKSAVRPEVPACAVANREGSRPLSVNSDRFGDDRFADNILRALEGLPQNGDAEEEEAAAEEGALIEASNYPDPASHRSFA